MSKMIRISDQAYSTIDKIAKDTGFSRQHIIDEAVKKWEQDILLSRANQSYLRLKKNAKKWQKDQEEIALWESTLSDGLNDE